MLDCRRYALIERHHDVGADDSLRLHAAFRAQTNQRIVHVAGEFGIVFAQGAAAGKRKYLIAARIRQHRSRPIHEAVNAPELFEYLEPRPQHQMVGIGEQHLGAALEKILTALRADGRVGSHRHERRGQNFVVPCRETRGACVRARTGGFEFEFQPPHGGGITLRLASRMK